MIIITAKRIYLAQIHDDFRVSLQSINTVNDLIKNAYMGKGKNCDIIGLVIENGIL